MFTLWLEGKIIFGDIDDGSDVVDKKNGHEYHENLISCGLWMLHGENREQFPFKKAENIITDDGVPVHGLKYNIDGVEFTEETFCNTSRKSSCYIKYTLKNTSNAQINQKFTIALRTGNEISLICGDGCDQYGDYNPIEDNRIAGNPSTRKWENDVYTDGERVLTQLEGETPFWNENEGFIGFNIVNDDFFVESGFPIINHDILGMLGVINKDDMKKIRTAMYRAGRAYKGLYGGMYHEPMGGLMWYTSAPEYRWFVGWKRFGDREKMQEILDYQLKYFVSPEYTMQERYIETIEYYTPWCPNASAMARTILMMLALEE